MLSNFKKLYGEKIELHSFKESFITDEYVSWLNDPEVVKFSNQRFHKHTIESCVDYLSSFNETDNLYLAILMKGSGNIVGSINAYINKEDSSADMGLLIGKKECWGNGLGLDAWKTLMNYLLNECNLTKVTGGTLRPNVGMVKIMEKSGMEIETGKLKQKLLDGKPQDVLFFAVNRKINNH